MKKICIDIETIRYYLKERRVNWTKHCLNRLQQRNIKIAEVKNAINNGKIIEYYYDDFPYPSCLILGYSIKNRILHVVCGINENIIHIITAYYPDKTKWKEDLETRRKK